MNTKTVKLTKGIKNLCSIFIIIYISSLGKMIAQNKETTIFDIIFATGFHEDSVDLFVNGTRVEKNKTLNSHPSDGLTGLNGRIIVYFNVLYYASLNNRICLKQSRKTKAIIEVEIIGKAKQNFIAKRKMGRYIVISYDRNINEIKFEQLDKEPSFD